MKRLLCVVLCILLAVAVVGCGAPEAEPSESAEASATVKPTPTPAVDLIETKTEKVFDIKINIPKEAEKNSTEWDDNVSFIVSDGTYTTYAIDITAKSYSDVLSENDLKNGAADGVWKNIKTSYNISNDEGKEEFNVNGVNVMKYTGEYTDGRDFILNYVVFFANNRTYMIIMMLDKNYQNEYSDYLDTFVNEMEIEIREPDILSDSDRRYDIDRMNTNLEYNEMLEIVNAYIADTSPNENDPAFKIKSDVEAILAILPECEIVSDEFEGSTEIYGGVSEVTGEINFVPYISPSNTLTSYVYAKVGFKQGEWVFFDKVRIKVGENDYIEETFSYGDTITDVIGGGTIKEEGDMSIAIERVGELLNVESPVMRFEGDDDKMREHTMTEAELSALNKIYEISLHRNNIDTIIKEWEENYA